MNKSHRVHKHFFLSILIFLSLVSLYLVQSFSDSGILYNLQFLSWIGLLLILYIFISWGKKYGRLFCPYIIIISTLYLTLCGQSIAWAFNMIAGYRDLRFATYNTLRFSNNSICKALMYSYICIITLHATVIIRTRRKNGSNQKKKSREKREQNYSVSNKKIYRALVIFGFSTLIISIIPYISTNLRMASAIRIGGYGIQYENVSYGVDSIADKIAQLFPVGVLTLLYVWGRKNEFNSKYFVLKVVFVIVMVALYLVIQLLLSQRTAALLFFIAIMFLFYSDRLIPKKIITFIILFGLVVMAGMRLIDLIRSGSLYTISDFVDYTLDKGNNPIMDFVGDIGWNLMTTVEFQTVIPSVRPFGFGSSYLVSLTSIIPNLNFWTVHPAYQYGNIAAWLQQYLGFSFGIGCTPVAEAYYNFGNLGFVMFVIWGIFSAEINNKFENKNNLLNNFQVVLFMGVLLKSFVRSSFFAVFRPYILCIWLPTILVKYLFKRLYK